MIFNTCFALSDCDGELPESLGFVLLDFKAVVLGKQTCWQKADLWLDFGGHHFFQFLFGVLNLDNHERHKTLGVFNHACQLDSFVT